MRKRVLGTIAAFTVGAGAAFAQSPQPPVPPPTAIGGMMPGYETGFQPAGGPQVGDIIPPPPGAFGPMGPGGPMGGPGGPEMMGYPGGPPGGGAPGYPPGLHGQRAWEDAFAPSGATPTAKANCFYLDTQFLLFWVKAQPANVPFVSTSAPQDSGLAGRPTTTLLHSMSDLGYGVFSGFNITAGYFKDADRRYGVELGGLLLERKMNTFFAQSDANGIPLLARPFIDATTGNPAVLTVAQQGLASGSVAVVSRNEVFGAEASCLANLYRTCPDAGGCQLNVNGIVGFRYLEIHEDLRIDSRSVILGGGTPAFNGAAISSPAVVGVSDNFDVFNRFYGGQVGLNSTATCGRWNFGLKTKLAVGLMNQTLDVDGRSNLLDTQRNLFAQGVGGLFANAQNIGRSRHDEFAVLADVGANVGYNWTSWFSTAIGYNFLGVDRVLRPGSVVTNVVNPAILPTSQSFGNGTVVPVNNRPLVQDEFWIQGVTFSMILKY